MKKCLSAFFSIAAAFFLFSGCAGPGVQDWTLSLTDGYEMWRINSQEIVLGRKENESLTPIVEADVIAYFMSGSYIGVQQTPTGAESGAGTNYYLLNTKLGSLYGPFDEAAFAAQCKTSGVKQSGWISTRPAPEGAKYG